MSAKMRRFLPDVPRLLKSKDQFRTLASPDAASSIAAFLAWKAFLLVARAETDASEKRRCQSSVVKTLRHFPDELFPNVRAFADTLQLFRDPRAASAEVFNEWFISLDDAAALSRDEIARERGRIARSIERLGHLTNTESTALLVSEGALLGEQLYRIRNSVIGHASVVTGMVLFDRIVPEFERVVSDLALFGRARLASMTAEEALKEFKASDA